MKLKKIASLMLAGIMAVSMLTACQGTNVDPEDPTNPVEPGTDGVSAEIGDMVEHPDYVVFKDSDALNNNLKDAVEYAGVLDVMPDYITADRLTTIAPDVAAELDELVGVTFLRNGITPVTLWNIGDAYVLLDAEREDSYKIPDAVAVEMYAVSSAIGEKAVKNQIADIIETLPEYQYSVNSTDGTGSTQDGGNFNHTYTVSVSTCTKAVNSSIAGAGVAGTGIIGGAETPEVTFVAIQVVRTAAHQ